MSDTVDCPRKCNLLGVEVSATTYDQALSVVIQAAQARRPTIVTHLAVHGLVTGSREPDLGAKLNTFDVVAPDGQPVRLALNLLYHTELPDRCYGPEFMRRVCRQAARDGVSIYLYGSYPDVVARLRDNLLADFPGLEIVGCEPSIFRPLTPEEDQALVDRFNASGAGVVFIGLGCPLQERFACEHKEKIRAVQICVGAAFDFHAGNKKMAPVWMQRHSLEWFYRLCQEPGRLWKRYLITNSLFLLKLSRQFLNRNYYPIKGGKKS